MGFAQKLLFDDVVPAWEGMPSTRYQGSKRKLLPLLYKIFAGIEFTTCLDAFGGTGSVTHLLSRMGKRTHYNEIMPASCMIAKALFANKPIVISIKEMEGLFSRHNGVNYKNIIEQNYSDIYFLDEENRQLDTFCTNVHLLNNEIAKAEAYYLLFQSMLCKRPYNLFHRANLHMRTKEVKRSFGNKVTWDKPFIEHMHKYYNELATYRETQSNYKVKVSCKSAFDLKGNFDLVYIDTPYAKGRGVQESNYFNFYHFLDAILDYENIPSKAVLSLKHKPLYEFNKPWHPFECIMEAFKSLFQQYAPSSLVISYRSDGHPTPKEIVSHLRKQYGSVNEVCLADYKYVLSKKNVDTKEIVIVAQNPL
jgi:adenine-specific DNA-methyltransferase